MNSDDMEDYTCFVCVIMSYGEPGVIFCRNESTEKNDPCELKLLQEPFKNHMCNTLAGKPKIFLVQVSKS